MAKTKNPTRPRKETHKFDKKQQQNPPSWSSVKGLFTCKDLKQEQQHKAKTITLDEISKTNTRKGMKTKCSGSLCSNTKVMHRPETSSSSPELHPQKGSSSSSIKSSSINDKGSTKEVVVSAISSGNVGAFKGMPFRRFSGCYECRMVVDPVVGFSKDPSLRSSICSCPDCGEIFVKPERLELHQIVRHGVSELEPEDTSKNIVEIIFKSSWQNKQSLVPQIDRILKVHNTQRTISNFENYRDSIKAKATKNAKKHQRCIFDGNELLRFHCTALNCSLGLNGSSNLCNSIPICNVCSIIKNGFKQFRDNSNDKGGILTTATSGKAHDKCAVFGEGRNENRAMLVCRVIAGRVKKSGEGNVEDFDSVAGEIGVYSNLEELFVYNPRAILPCFVVIYSGFS